MNSLRYLRGATVYVQTGKNPNDRKFFRITARQENKIHLKALKTVEVDGKPTPGEIDPDGEKIWRRVRMIEGQEYGAPYLVNGIAMWLRLYRKPKGGMRPGAGRPAGKGKGRTQESRSLCLNATDWELFDRLRGDVPRGKFVRKLLYDWHLRNP
jgi:hypothetical protein